MTSPSYLLSFLARIAGCLSLLGSIGAQSGAPAAYPDTTAESQGPIEITLTEPKPGEAALADPVVAADWPDVRRALADKILVRGSPVGLEQLRQLLSARRPLHVGDEQDAPDVVLLVAANRRWSDLTPILGLFGEPAIGPRRITITVAGATDAPTEDLTIYFSDALPGKQALSDAVVARDWPKERVERAQKIYADDQLVTQSQLGGILRERVDRTKAAPSPPGGEQGTVSTGTGDRWPLCLRVEVALSRPWSDMQVVLDLCADPAIGIRHLEIVPVTWRQKAATAVLPAGQRVRLGSEGKFGVQWEWTKGALVIAEVDAGGCREAGIKAGDRVVAVDGAKVSSEDDVLRARDAVHTGARTHAIMQVMRGSRRLQFVVTK